MRVFSSAVFYNRASHSHIDIGQFYCVVGQSHEHRCSVSHAAADSTGDTAVRHCTYIPPVLLSTPIGHSPRLVVTPFPGTFLLVQRRTGSVSDIPYKRAVPPNIQGVA